MGEFNCYIEIPASKKLNIQNILMLKSLKLPHLKGRLSPLRYPGGKSKLTDFVASKIDKNHRILVSPFAGGSSVELNLLANGYIDHLILNDLDYSVYSFFKVITTSTLFEQFLYYLNLTKVDHTVYQMAHNIVNEKTKEPDIVKQAIAMLINNRCSYSGIFSAGPTGGKNGTIQKLNVRFNKPQIIKQCITINKLASKIEISNSDASTILKQYSNKKDITFFVDPPYVEKGNVLYKYFYQEKDHISLISQCENITKKTNNNVILFYDNAPLIKNTLVDPPIYISRKYSI